MTNVTEQDKRSMTRRSFYLPMAEIERLQERAEAEDRSVSYILTAVLRGWDGRAPKA